MINLRQIGCSRKLQDMFLEIYYLNFKKLEVTYALVIKKIKFTIPILNQTSDESGRERFVYRKAEL